MAVIGIGQVFYEAHSAFGMAGGRLMRGSWRRSVEMTDVPEDWSCDLGWPPWSAGRNRPRWTTWQHPIPSRWCHGRAEDAGNEDGWRFHGDCDRSLEW